MVDDELESMKLRTGKEWIKTSIWKQSDKDLGNK